MKLPFYVEFIILSWLKGFYVTDKQDKYKEKGRVMELQLAVLLK